MGLVKKSRSQKFPFLLKAKIIRLENVSGKIEPTAFGNLNGHASGVIISGL